LLDKEQKFVAFGYDAENQYADLVMDKKHDDYYFFHLFKMKLHSSKVFQFRHVGVLIYERARAPAFHV
jgi:hypothetical protein